MIIPDAIEAFLRNRKTRNCRLTTRKCYSKHLGNLAKFLRLKRISNTKKLTVEAISEYVAARLDAGISPTTVNTERAVVVMFCAYLTGIKEAPKENWRQDVPRLRTDTKPPKHLSDDECRSMIDVVENLLFYREPFLRRRDLAIVSLLLDTGIRASEILRLTLDDIGLESQSIYINEESKSRRARQVWVSKETAKALRQYMGFRLKYTPRSDHLFITRLGKPVKYSALYKIIVRAARACGMHVTPHALRHTNATSLINSGMSLSDVKVLLGHSSVRTTERYVHLANEDVRRRFMEVAPMDRLTGEQA